jgi:acyl-CoA reductase-like NAD-dependent aldehyde dehydrogenase
MEERAVNIDLLINNEDMSATDGATFERHDPMTLQVATRAAAATAKDAIAAADAAHAAFAAWSSTGPSARRALLLRAADELQRRTQDFTEIAISEIGATAPWIAFNVGLAADILREAAALTTRVGGQLIPSDRPGCLAMSVRQPAGVVLGIAPWNAPIILGVRAIATPLACGNTIVLKASELCPATHRMIGTVMRDAGFPPGVVNVISNAPRDAAVVVGALISHPAVRRINFTGSTRVGRIIAAAAARELKPVLLELGGKAPMIVLDDADLDQAVNAAAFGSFMNQGQICMSTERIIVQDEIADAFVRKFVAKARSLPAGNPRDRVVLGSLVDHDAVTRIQHLISSATARGAELVLRGQVTGSVMGASVLDRVTPRMEIYSEESFGPVVCVVRVKDDEEALRMANDTEYGLSSAVFSRDIARALNFARRIEAGMCHINGPTVHDEAQMPFGGMKASGYGRFGGEAGIAEFTDTRWITINTEPVHYPF